MYWTFINILDDVDSVWLTYLIVVGVLTYLIVVGVWWLRWHRRDKHANRYRDIPHSSSHSSFSTNITHSIMSSEVSILICRSRVYSWREAWTNHPAGHQSLPGIKHCRAHVTTTLQNTREVREQLRILSKLCLNRLVCGGYLFFWILQCLKLNNKKTITIK